MSSTIDPAKLKVVDLRSELVSRGLDSKGNKAALVKRLKDALELELKQDLPDTSIADTSTEDLDTSQSEEKIGEEQDNESSSEEKMETDELKPEKTPEKSKKTNSDGKPDSTENSQSKGESVKTQDSGEPKQNSEENGEHSEHQGDEKSAKKSRWTEDEKPSEEADSQSGESKDDQPDTSKPDGESEQKGEKRRRSSLSPERSQRRRSRSPVKEDEPVLDNDKVQLSWYDSDLHLQLDKESFLSAKPLTEGAFGYAWAGVRATHGVSSGKVCYEVKITEELKWEDFAKHEQRGGRDRYRTDHRKNQRRDKKGGDKKTGDKPKPENGEDKPEKDEKSSEKEEKDEKDEKLSSETEETSAQVEKSEDKEEKSTEEKEVPADKDVKLEDTAKEDDKPAETKDKPADEASKDESQDAEATPMETDASEETKKPEEAEGEAKSKEETEKTDAEETKIEPPSEPLPTHLFRVGWSVITASLQLGEDKISYGYESSGRFVTDKQFVDYGVKFGAGDVIGAFLSLDEESVTIRYTVNGEVQPIATSVPRSELPEEDFVLFPHVLSRNYAFELNLGEKEEPWFPLPADLEDYEYISKVEDKVAGPLRPENRAECEVILMCGLPGSGKTHWVKEYVSSNVEKKYTVLGNSNLLEKMTISGEPLKTKYKGRWSMLVDRIQKCLNKLIAVASLRRRNYIIDQTNVFPSAQRRKMRPFEGFKRRAVIVVVGDEEQARRQSLQETQDGKDVPDSTILEMKAAMSLPEKGDWMDEVSYVGLEEAEAKEVVKKYNAAGKEAGYGGDRRFGRRDDRWHNRRNDNRGKNYRDRSYHNQRYDPRAPRHGGGWDNQRSGNWNRDRRDNRGPPSSREWRGSGRDRGSRDNRVQGGNYNRNRPQGGGRGGQGGWSGNWNQGWNQQQSYGGSGGYGGNQNWGNQWKYGSGGGGGGGSGTGGGQGYGGGYGGNWNYYGQYAQNWNNQGQQAHSATGTGSGNATANSQQYSHGYNTQEAWAQYAQQYAQQAAAVQHQGAAVAKK